MTWNLSQVNNEDIDVFSQKYGADRNSSALLLGRDLIDPDELKFFLHKDLRFLHNPFLFSQMDSAVVRIQHAITEGEKVLVFGDRDADGITAVVLLVSALREEGLEVSWEVPMGDAPYALSTEVVNKYAKEDVTLCITVDCGISNISEIAGAQESGMDCIVLDHHNPMEELPQAVAIINPKCNFESYPFEGLSAVGLVLKLLTAIDISKSTFYDQQFCFLNLRPGNMSTIVEAVKLINMTEQSRISETIVHGSGEQQLSRVIDFISDQAILIYQQEYQSKLLSDLLGNAGDIAFTDISESIWKEFPTLKGKSLLRMLQGSRLNKFSKTAAQEIDAAVQLLASYFYAANPNILQNLEKRLDLVAMGLIADMMPLVNENRILVHRGLEVLEHTSRPGLRELMARLKLLDHRLTSREVSWRLIPTLNATGRLGRPDLAISLLLEEGNIVDLADSVYTLNEKRKDLSNNAWKIALPRAKESLENYEKCLSYVYDPSLHRGITGILAGRLCRELNVPAIVVAALEDDFVGSARSVRGLHVTDFLSYFSEVFDTYGGHDAAGGFRFKKDRYEAFLSMLKEKSAFIELAGEGDQQLTVDLELDPSEVSEDLEQFQFLMEPFGQAFQEVHYLVRNVQILSVQVVGKDASHLRMLLSIAHRKWPAMYWSAAERYQRDFDTNSPVDCVFTIERNYFGTGSNLQLTILDVKTNEN